MRPQDQIPADRLCDAVDAVLLGLRELGDHPLASSPSELLGHEDQPDSFVEFTRVEIEAAQQFLNRCGLLGDTFPNTL